MVIFKNYLMAMKSVENFFYEKVKKTFEPKIDSK